MIAAGGLFLQAYRGNRRSVQAIATFRPISADADVIGASGLSAEYDLTTPHHLLAEVGGTIVERAQRTIVVANASKIGRGGPIPIGSAEQH